jgi:hypothetical protein
MKNKFKTPKISNDNVISFTCSDTAVEPLLELFGILSMYGQAGCSREVVIDWDGDGSDQLENISVNGMKLTDWEIEWKRLDDIENKFKNNINENKDENNS